MEKHYICKHSLPVCLSVTSLVTVYHNVSMYNRKQKPEVHDFPELFYVSECGGEHGLLLDGKEYALTKGQLMIYPPNAVHQGVRKSNAVIDIISFETDSDISCLYGKIITLNARQAQALTELMSAGIRIFQDAPCSGYDKGMSLHQRANAYELQRFKNSLENFLIDLYLSQRTPENLPASNSEIFSEEQFDRIVCYMKRNVDKSLSLSELAEAFSFSVTKIQRLFYKHTGCAPMQYFTELKLQAAKEMICGTAMNHTQISAMLGFSSVSYFSKLFKKKTGVTPSEYAKTLRSGKC